MRTLIAIVLSLLLPSAAGAAGAESGFSAEPRVETTFGTGGYRSVDSEARFGVPHGFSLTLGHNMNDDDGSDQADTYRLQLQKEFERSDVSLKYSRSPMSNDYESRIWGFGASARNSSEDFQTAVGFDGEVVHHGMKFILANRQAHSFMSQRSLIARVTQHFWKTRVTAELGNYSYNKDAAALMGRLTRSRFKNTISVGNAIGVLSGFPDTSQDYKVSQRLGDWPVTLWGGYSNVQFITATAADQRTSDTISGGIDAEAEFGLAGGFSYQYVRQTSQDLTRLYSFNLSWLF